MGHSWRRAARVFRPRSPWRCSCRFTYGMDPTIAIVLLASTYVGAEYGGSIPAILIRTPGTNAAAATVVDGYAMKEQGKAGEALGISLYSGVLGGMFGLAILVLLTEPLSRIALAFTPAAYFSLGVLGLSVIASVSGGSLNEGADGGSARIDDRDRWHRSRSRESTALHSTARSCCRAYRRFWSWWVCLPLANCWHRPAKPGWQEGDQRRSADPVSWCRDAQTHCPATGDRLGNGHLRRHHAGRRRHYFRILWPTTRRDGGLLTRKNSGMAHPRALPRRRPPIIRSPAPRWCRC